jgi:hypothetical protein
MRRAWYDAHAVAGAISAAWVATVHDALQPASISVWTAE